MFRKYTLSGFRKALEKQDVQKIQDYLAHKNADQFLSYHKYGYHEYSPINYTIRCNLPISFGILLNSGKIDVTQKQGDGCIPLKVAIAEKHMNFFHIIHNKIEDIGIIDNAYLLHYAITKKEFEMFKTLINKGANIDQQDSRNNTPLHISFYENALGFAEFLINKGARTDIRNKEGLTAKHLLEGVKKHGRTNDLLGDQKNDRWEILNDTAIAHIQIFSNINRQLTEIFNFKSKERLIISENLKTQAESTTPPESFHTLDINITSEAFEIYKKKMKNKIPDGIDIAVSTMLKSKPPSTTTLEH